MVVRSGDDFHGNGWCWISLKSRHYWTDAAGRLAATLFIFLHQTKDLIKVVSVDTMIQIFSSAREVFVQGIKVRGARKAVVKLEEKCGAAPNAII